MFVNVVDVSILAVVKWQAVHLDAEEPAMALQFLWKLLECLGCQHGVDQVRLNHLCPRVQIFSVCTETIRSSVLLRATHYLPQQDFLLRENVNFSIFLIGKYRK